MFIILGTKTVTKRRGQVGHFCPICREIAEFDAAEVRVVRHLYFVPLGFGTPVLGELTCRGCRTLLAVETAGVAKARKRKGMELVDFAAETSPSGASGLAERMELEERARRGEVEGPARMAMLIEPFAELEHLTHQMQRKGHAESLKAVLAVVAIGLGVASAMCWNEAKSGPRTNGTMLAWAVCLMLLDAAALGGLAWVWVRSKRWTAAWYALKPLARSLRPLRPMQDELEAVIRVLRKRNSAVAKGVEAEQVMRAVEGGETGRG